VTRMLLDTHVFLWHITADRRMPKALADTICDANNEVFLSVVSVWEAVIKYSLGKLPLPEPPALFLPKQRQAHQIASLLIDEDTLVHVANLPPLHRDPFDRLLVGQALQHNLTIATVDDAIRAYTVPTA
jgi:PIN domain nuclease of toxin-antitoxin system